MAAWYGFRVRHGYMAGLIGSSNSPLSGVGYLVVIGAALLLVFGVKPLLGGQGGPGLVAFALFITAVVFAVATIAAAFRPPGAPLLKSDLISEHR
jgi:uncharacterized oligopeptide transporter (OPT) family protein